MAKITFPDGTVHSVDASNQSSEFNSYIAQSRAQGRNVDAAAEAQAFDQVIGRSGPETAVPDMSTGFGNAASGIMGVLPSPVASAWTDSSHYVVNGASKATSFATTETHKLADAIATALPAAAAWSEFMAVAVIAASAFGVVYLVRRMI